MENTQTFQYTVVFEHEADGGYHAFCPALPGCHSQGETVEEAADNVREAIEVYLESLRAPYGLAYGAGHPLQHRGMSRPPVGGNFLDAPPAARENS